MKNESLSHVESRKLYTQNILNSSLFSDDIKFESLFPEHLQSMSPMQWSPLDVVQKAASFLVTPDAKILDIGCGIGKFCLAGAYYFPEAFFFGVEQRYDLVILAEEAKQYTGLSNAHFIHANITQTNFSEFDHFYFYNAFYENIDMVNRIDDTIQTSYSLYFYYTQYLLSVLRNKPSGTKVVTFHSSEGEIPPSYKLINSYYNSLLKMWIKE